MDLPLYLKVIVLGLLEGATEFLPVSSTGHLIIANDLLSFTGERAKTFDIFIQLGAICAIVWHYRRRIGQMSGTLLSDPAALRFAINILIGFLPAALLGLFLHKTIKAQLFNPITVAGALIVGGFIILMIESRRRPHRVENVDDLTWHVALKVGFAQSLALFPGVSRAGATIMGGLLSGMSRSVATEFSFFLAIPTMFAATLYDLYKNLDIMRPEDLEILATGFVAAFFSAWLVIRALLAFVARHSFKAFAWYRIMLGSLVLTYFLSSAELTVPL
ncbi:undecaprenyl-diphosphate phosphatase [Methylocaldum sp.]|uniref:undecaprenyl-diphosphate phosphatase n=1 Tax=Methylocaldum sp. TaxID=1969727 RepID=UPI002D542A8E|nr:undecaprenyl-diphosphate phosphatase [Methylocaldum sp.]HYE37171.1 undecaprenyl-diphosphate phosphatase [Methylocaldum sp.]